MPSLDPNEWLHAFNRDYLRIQETGVRDHYNGVPPRKVRVYDESYWRNIRPVYLHYLHGYATGHERCECDIEKRRFTSHEQGSGDGDRMVGSHSTQ